MSNNKVKGVVSVMASKQASEVTVDQKHHDLVSDEETEETTSYSELLKPSLDENRKAPQQQFGEKSEEVTTVQVRPAEQGTENYPAKIGKELSHLG